MASSTSSRAQARTPDSRSPRGKRRTPEQEQLLAQRRQEREAQTRAALRNGLIWVGGFVLCGGTLLWLWLDSAAAAESERAAAAKRHDELRTELLADGNLTPERAPRLLQRIAATRAEWATSPDHDAIERQAEQARGVVKVAAATAAVATDLQALERDLATEGKSLDTWQQLHDRARALHDRTDKSATAVLAQLDALGVRVDGGWFEALQAAGASAQPPAAGLATLTQALDLGLDHAAAQGKKRDDKAVWTKRLTTLVSHLDAAQTAAFDERAIAAVAWQDLHPVEADWVVSRSGNVERKLHGDTLTVRTGADQRGSAAVLVLRQQSWHACSLAFSLRLDQGRVLLFGRATTQFGERDGGGLPVVTTAGPDSAGAIVVPAGQEVAVELTIVGDQFTATVDGGTPHRLAHRIKHTERRGSFAAVMRPETVFALGKLRIRRLG
jgi:hypothetical protein